MASAWTHLPSRQGGGIHTRPTLLNCFTMSPADTPRIVERIVCLTRCTVTREVEFGDEIRELETLDVEVGVTVGESLEMMYRPLASDIIRYDNVGNSDGFQHGCNNIIRIDVSTCGSIFGTCSRRRHFTVLLAVDHQPHSFERENAVHTRKRQHQTRRNPSRTWRSPG